MKKTLSPSNKKNQTEYFPIVAIGASAGGLEAVTQLFENLPSDIGMAFLYVQHLDPTHKSMLGSILSKVAAIKVTQIESNVRIVPNHIYICPPGKDMTVQGHNIKLHKRTDHAGQHSPIDKLFFSLSENLKEGVIGIVLSGSGSDGAAGMKAIHSMGGLTFAQDKTAKFQIMPKAAIAANAVDLVLSPREMAKELKRLGKNKDVLGIVMKDDDHKGILEIGDNLDEVFHLLKRAVRVDFNLYRKNTIKRRIARRMLLLRMLTFKEYVTYLEQHAEETEALYRDLLINVTSFFRERETMEYLGKTVIPRILESKSHGEPVRIWVPGCASGEEAYSIAIVLLEAFGKKASNNSIRIFATDLSGPSIAKARTGLYSVSELEGVTSRRIQRFFTKVDSRYRIAKSIRDLCVFSEHNVFRDPPFSRMDLISCSNLLIYLETVVQKKVIATFYYALNPGGYLRLGKSETLGTLQNLFAASSKKLKIYKKKGAITASVMEMNHKLPLSEKAPAQSQYRMIPREINPEKSLNSIIDNLMLKNFVFPGVVVNPDLEIIQFRGSTNLFLEPSSGKASLSLLKMARPGLGFELKNAVRKVMKSGESYVKTGLEIKHDHVIHHLNIEVTPISVEYNGSLFLIIFRETVPLPVESSARSHSAKDRKIRQLEKELVALREDMRSIVEEQEAVNEELQSANEEVLSSNEELQSINEELETSKEEIESTNEELMTTNRELLEKNEELAEAHEFSAMIISTIVEAVVMLDRDLRIVNANETFYRNFQFRPGDVERQLFFEIGNGEWNIPDLRRLIEEANRDKNGYRTSELEVEFSKKGKKTLRFNAKSINRKNAQPLIFLAIEDVTERDVAARIIAEREAWFRNVADNTPALIWVAGPDKRRTFFNKSWLEYTGRKLADEVGSGWMKNVYKNDLARLLSIIDTSFEKQEPYYLDYRLKRYDGPYRWIRGTGKPSYSPTGNFAGFVGACYEIHDQKVQNEELEKKVKERTYELTRTLEKEKELNELKTRFVTIASHEFRTPLTTILSSTQLLEQYHGEMLEAVKEKHVTRIKSSVQMLKEILSDFLSLEKLEQKKVHLKEEIFDMDLEINTIVERLDGVLKPKQTILHTHVGEKQIVQDKNLLRNVLMNLISNASKFSPEGKEILVNSEVSDSKIILSVNDKGIGIPEDEQKNIFQKFYRAKNADNIQGTGLGLNIVERYVQLMGGSVHFISKLDQGSTFTIEIPIN